MLLLENKKMFEFLEYIPEHLSYLYNDAKKKSERLEKDIQPVDFFKDGQFNVISTTDNYIADFKQFWEEEEVRVMLFKK